MLLRTPMYYTTIVAMTDKRLHYLLVVCFHVLMVFVPFYFRFSTEELFEFNKLLAVYSITAMVTGLWLSRMIVRQEFLWKRTPFDIPIAVFLVTQILSTLLSIHPRTSLLGYYTRFHGGLLSYIAYTLLYYAAVNTLEKKHIKPLLVSAIGAASLVALYGILEHFGHSVSCAFITNGKSFDTSCWIQDVQSRVFATFGQPNWLAAYAITLWPVATWVGTEEKASKLSNIVGYAGWTLLSIVLIYTKSRSGFLGLGVAMLAIICMRIGSWLWLRRSRAHTTRPATGLRDRIFAVGIALQLGLFAILGTPFTPSVVNRIISTNSVAQNSVTTPATSAVDRLEAGGTDSGEIRKIVWTGAIAVWRRYPLLGSGVETFAYSYYLDRPKSHNQVSEWDFLYNKAHNEVLNFFATTGSLGGIAYLMLVGWVFVVVWKMAVSTHISSREQLLSICISGGIAGLFTSNFFGFSTVMVTVLWFLFLSFVAVLCLEHQAQPAKHTAKKQAAITPNLQVFGFGLTWFSVLISLILIYRMYAADTAFALGKSLLASGDFFAGSQQLQRAISLAPREALYYDELAHHMAKTAVDVAATNDATSAAQLANTAALLSDTALTLNPVHLNFFKTRARIFITLAQLDPKLLQNAKEALLAALERSPTDAKIVYNLALVEMGLGNEAASTQKLQQAILLKPNYGAARLELAKSYIAGNALNEAQTELEYILQHINPGDPQTLQLLEHIATVSSQTKKP